ncbi:MULTISPECIES: hypothetical protein [unclassified Modestobacter]
MAARLWTVLLVMAGVFAMHGLQCASAHDLGHGTGVHAGAVPATGATGDGHPVSTGGHAQAGHDPVGASMPAAGLTAPDVAGYESTPRSPTGQLWTLCLAVLAVGTAALRVLLAHRLGSVAVPVPARFLGRVRSWAAPLRPPDLSALCLLRI